MTRLLFLPILFISSVAMVGCEGAKTTGKVTFDGALVDNGTIVFIPSDGKGASVSAPIKNGDFAIAVPGGSYKVSVTAEKMMQSSSTIKGAPDEMRNYIPARYQGSSSELTATVDGKPLTFDLKPDADKKKK
ncbi:hypothetical protein [Zavarzinella formosa]|uniref:hypothetical protein n=1 Tax=Zavarzinella formosa TaxID=360055 RepID=UPI0002D9A936|nr:hypothetical protein [Zavarzinella formosa]